MTTTKATIKAAYIRNLKAKYDFYADGSRPLELANKAADAALAGTTKLQGECWDDALIECGIKPRPTMRELAGLPA